MKEKNCGTQPLNEVMTRLGLSNADLVKASTEQLSFRMVQKGRKGRRLTVKTMSKILNAIKKLKPAEEIDLANLFNPDYAKR